MRDHRGDRVLVLKTARKPFRIVCTEQKRGTASLDSKATVIEADQVFREFFGGPEKHRTDTSLLDLISHDDEPSVRRLMQQVLNTGAGRQTIVRSSRGGQFLLDLDSESAGGSESKRICVVAAPLTEFCRADRIHSPSQVPANHLSARLLQLQDEERRRIARDLHDVTGQKLAVESIDLAGVLDRSASCLDPESLRLLAECVALTKEIGNEIRALSYLLHPPLLDELGLPAAIKWYAERFQTRTGIAVEVELNGNLQRMPADVETSLFRILQESLTNVQRYSGSAKARVRLEGATDEIRLEVDDFGRGMSKETEGPRAENEQPVGVGIPGMRERMRELSGRLEISSRRNEGTTVIARLPTPRVRNG